MSGDKIGFLDPHKQCFEEGRSGAQYDIQSNLLEGDSRDQFKPFKGVFDFDFSQNYQSTLFRFPLRTCPSKLSQTQYTKEKIDMLFESLREEASIILLFMKNIQHISVYERMEGDKEAKCIFKVEIAPEMCDTVRQERQEMLESAVKGGVTESSYIVDFCFSSKSEKKCFKWLVLNQIGLEGDERIAELSKNLSLLPWVGCAVPLNSDAQKEDTGRIFCFLPLPHDVDCQTGLPILVHGVFGVTDNRRGLIWPGSECQNETADWNVLLVEKILSSVVYNAVKSLITDSPNSGLKKNQRRRLIYSTLPELSCVKGHWNCLLDPLFQKLKQLNLFLAQSSSCTSWITLQDGLLDQMKKSGVSEKTRNAVLKTLQRNSQLIITGLPDHVNEIVDKFFGEREDITSDFFRNFLRNNSIEPVSRDNKLMLLDYTLHDNPQPEELSNIPLLPLASGGFGTFSEHCHDSDPSLSVLVSDASCTEDLLPNMEDRFLDKKIPKEIYQKLVDMAKELLDEVNPTQMIKLTPELVISYLPSSLPDEWLKTNNQKVSWKPDSPGHPPEKWITDIWHWINDTFESLEQLEGIPLIPLDSNSDKSLGVLRKKSKFIFKSDPFQNMQLPSEVVGLLEAAGCLVLPCLSSSLHVRHPDISSYIASALPTEVTLMLGRSSMESAEDYITSCSNDERKSLQKFLASSQVLSEEEKNVLSRLPFLFRPYEPITARIKSILKEYKEGVGIFKELIQNADDAGATTVKFLVDWRQGKTDSLFSPDMAQSQGPALWAFNNAVFTDKDFENINKLAGGTKVEDLSKIGRFGLGFNAVYHLTDVPSFISRNFLCVFDPNVNHISNHIRDKSRPGIRVDLAKNPRPLTAFADQFAPYDQVFGCKTTVNNGEKFHFQGTLFRFSFRTDGEAKKSEICDTVYNAAKVKEIVSTLQRSASLILLFTQNVTDVELHELVSTGNPQNTSLILSIEKEIQRNKPVPSYIKQCSEWWQNKLQQLPLDEAPSRLELVEIVKTENPSSITDVKTSHKNSCRWLVAYCTGKNRSIKFAEEEGQKDGLLPLAGAAALLQCNSNDCMTAEHIKGEAFCFLPLSISTGLPIHVNSSFAVRSNRDGIWEKTTAEENLESRWNDSLLQDAIPEAYFKLLFGLVDLSKKGALLQFDKHFHDLWPRLTNSRTSWMTLVSSFYTKLVQRDLKLFSSNGKWLGITDGLLLDDELRNHEDDKVVKTLQSLGKNVFDLPSEVISAMRTVVDIKVHTLSLVSFFTDFLFPNLRSVSPDLRNPIVHRGLSYIFLQSTQDWQELESLYGKTKCIPCSPDGQKLARPCDLIDPNAENMATLYSPEENRFPFGKLDDSQLNALRKLGMVNDLLSWKEIRDRAESIEDLALNDKENALKRSRFLIKYLSCNIERLRDNKGMLGSQHLQEIEFLPVRLTPPDSYTLPWEGAEFDSIEFRCPNDLFLPKDAYLIGSSCLIVDDTDEESGCGSLQVLENLLGFTQRRPRCEQVLEQLEVARDSHADDNVKNKVCYLVYKHLNYELHCVRYYHVIEKLKNMSWLFVRGKFVENRKLALEWEGYAEPFLYSVPDNYQQEFSNLLELTGIKKIFTARDFLEALDSLWKLKKNSPLAPDDVKLVVTLTNELKDNFDNSVKQRVGKIPLPDTLGLLCNSNDLTIPESFDVKYKRKNERYIHSDINRNVALKLGAKPLRARRREKHGNTRSISFRRFEKLTDRIKNILKSYPCDVGILKELVQNADDAKATEIQFIYDKRTLSHERVLQTNANEIQGPALCVYNNKFFSEQDFDGICKLGIGSKQDDAAKTGQYGIGFNAVYHLTDCPSFLSNDDILCILDPHCEYSPEATAEAPGGRYNNIDHDFRDIFSDTVAGYLGEFDKHFRLPGGTMFRLPLRTDEQAKKSEISNRPVTDKLMMHLIRKFQNEAKKLLLFLNHVKKISLWEITDESELKPIYSVSSQLERKDERKLHELQLHLQNHKNLATGEIPMKDITYTISVEDKHLKEKWLFHQNSGIKKEAVTDEQIPNVRDLGLFPRGGIAALLPSSRVSNEEYVAYCFLPLPVKTRLPVHVNGHFALDGSRRDLWFDTSVTCRKTKWNAFMKVRVLGPAYASLITNAREYLPYCEKDSDKIYFSSKDDTAKALEWYHKLFPNPDADPKWKPLAVAVYQCLKESPVLPVVSQSRSTFVSEEDKQEGCKPNQSHDVRFPDKCKEASGSSGSFRTAPGKYSCQEPKYQELARELHSEHVKTASSGRVAGSRTNYYIEWLPSNCVYFTEEKEREILQQFLATLLRIRMPVMLYTPLEIHEALVKSEVESHLLTPGNVIQFLLKSQDENSRYDIGKLPVPLGSSNFQNKSNLRCVLVYCEEVLNKIPQNLEGLPLLLTDDNMLRNFTSESPVYCSSFGKLFPSKSFKFVHLDFVPKLSSFCGLKHDIIRELTIESLAVEFMPDVFRGKLALGKKEHSSWNYPENSVLSKRWFVQLWKFLKTAANPKESNAIKIFLGKYPIIPTTDGKLATIDNAKSVLAVSDNKKGKYLEQQVIQILESLNCPFLDKSITEDAASFVLSFVANPHSVSDVLYVLFYMKSTGTLDMGKLDEEKINTLLRFFQEDWPNIKSMNVAKTLPLYKGVDGNYHSLSSYFLCIQVPGGLPDDGIKELQCLETNILFLLPAFDLNPLYQALGIEVNCSIHQFYITYVLPRFPLFSRECQIKLLAKIRDSSPYMTEEIIERLKFTSCIPDQSGKLRVASSYFNPHDDLFKVMLKSDANSFPAAPFNEQGWIVFLIKIGLKENCDEQQFITFARRVEHSARSMSEYDKNIFIKSKALVKYLVKAVRNWSYNTISQIEFIAPEEIESELTSLYSQYHVDGKLEFLSYRQSVPWRDRNLVWSTVKLIPDWAYPHIDSRLVSFLGILSKPPLPSVVEHVKIISKCASDIVVSGRPLPPKIIAFFKDIYEFLKEIIQSCPGEPPYQNCLK